MHILLIILRILTRVFYKIYIPNIIIDNDFEGSIEYYTLYRIEFYFLFIKCLHPILLLLTLK